jgi:hypothetical protein
MLAVLLVAAIIAPVAAADPSPSASPGASPTIGLAEATPTPTPTPTATPTPTTTPTPSLVVSMTQTALSYDAATNKAQVRVTVTASGAAAPWDYSVAVRGTTVRSGSSSAASVSVSVTNDCSITTQSVTTQVTDDLGRTAGTAATLNRSLCPPPPDYPHARDRILAGPTLTETSFVDRLRAVGSPALAEGRSIYRTLVAGGVNPAFALGTFHAESHSGTRGYATTTKNWGNILFYSWEIEFGATPYAPGNGYTYAKYPTWLASVRAYVDLLQRYDRTGYTTVSSASARWLGTIEGSDRHLRYLNNITAVMRILPDDAVPSISSLSVPATSKAAVTFSWTAKDNLAITGYQVRYRRGTTGTYSAIQSTTTRTHTFTLTTGSWTIAVRASDAAGNWSGWRTARVSVDAIAPTMTSLRSSMTVVRSVDSRFTASWAGTDNAGITRYQWRTRRRPDGTPSVGTTTSLRSGTFRFGAGTWELDVRARDAVGNWSAWRSVTVIVPRDDRLFSFSTGTTRRTHTAAYRTTLTTSSVAGAKLEVTTADGDGFFLVGRVGPAYGRMRVTVDGESWIVDSAFYKGTRATAYHDAVLIFSTRFAPGAHTVTIENLATSGRPTIAIDGLDFSR